MLLNVHVKNLALIEDVDVCFDEGLNILSGETGAGKSIILGSINIALGHKAPKEMVRDGAEYGLAELVFSVDDEDTKKYLKEAGVSFDDGDDVIISRKIVNGRSIIKINGETFSVGELKNIAGYLINIHGQHDSETLLHRNKHLEILDEYGGEDIAILKNDLKFLYDSYKELNEKLDDFQMDEEERLREMSLLEFQIEEITDANLTVGEDDALEERFKFMSNALKIANVLSEIHETVGGNGALGNIGKSVKEIGQIVDYDSNLVQIQNQLFDLEAICSDVERDLSSYINKLSFDEEETMEVSKRLDLINRFKAKYGNTIEKIKTFAIKSEERLSVLQNFGEEREKLINDIENIKKEYFKTAAKLTEARKEKAEVFAGRLIEALTELNFMEVRFEVKFEDASDMTAKGMDVVEFMISTNTGESIKPLAEIASGGELSRIMLGLKSIMADKDRIGTMIFDEIDSGISGRTAQKVSERLQVLSKEHQIICITHLPQIAAMADNHYLIEKNVKNGKTVTEITGLSEDESVKELARMLGGMEITENVLANAREMKAFAKSKK
ncbi:MAG: DNA repair protein RecN [Lachnospiraceae bacterium]|nr:DNA repair protein RecN [Lachnospiraceae bacterium]